jgi:SAM-dependent methyltransferase
MVVVVEPDSYLDMAAVEERHWWYRGRRRVLIRIVAGLALRPDAKILELGSGTGGNLRFLSRFGKVTAVETNATARAIARAKHAQADVREGALPHDLRLPDQKFDLICMFDVLEHVDDDLAALRAARAHLEPDGKLLVTVPAYKALFGPHDEELHHKRRYERAELQARLRGAGLRIDKLTFMNCLLLPAAWAVRMLDKALHRPQASNTGVPAAPLNALFAGIFGAEAWVIPFVSLPFGLTLLALASPDD